MSDEHYREVFKGQRYFRAIREAKKKPLFFVDRNIHGSRFEREHPFNKWKTGGHENEEVSEDWQQL